MQDLNETSITAAVLQRVGQASSPRARQISEALVRNLHAFVRKIAYANRVTAKLAISAALGMPLARLTEDERAFIDAVLAETLERRAVLNRVMARLRPGKEARC